MASPSQMLMFNAQVSLMCLKDNGVYCSAVGEDLQSQMSNTNVSRPDFCTNKTAVPCVKAVSSAKAALSQLSAQVNLQSCVANVQSSASSTTNNNNNNGGNYGSPATMKGCLQQFADNIRGVDQQSAQYDMMCATADGTPTGPGCFGIFNQVTTNATINDCYEMAHKSRTCSAACDSALRGGMDSFGCCSYYIAKMTANPQVDDSRLPNIANVTGLTLEGANTSQIMGPLDVFDPCPSVKENKAKYVARCQVSAAAAVRKTLRTAFAFNALQKDPALMARAKAAMKSDVAASILVSTDAILNDTFVIDTSRKITVNATSSSRRQTTSTDAASYQFSLAGDDSSATTAASALFDAKAATGTLSSTSTASVVSSCTGCVDNDAAKSGSAAVVTPMSAAPSTCMWVAMLTLVATAITTL